MEVDNEVSGNGNSYTTEFRQYDPRLGRWKSLDPMMAQFSDMSPYIAFDDNPIYYVDPTGLYSEKRAQRKVDRINKRDNNRTATLIYGGEKQGYGVFAQTKNENGKVAFAAYFEDNKPQRSDGEGVDYASHEYAISFKKDDEGRNVALKVHEELGGEITRKETWNFELGIESPNTISYEPVEVIGIVPDIGIGKGFKIGKWAWKGIAKLFAKKVVANRKTIVNSLKEHAFSAKHLKAGVMDLGKSKKEIIKDVVTTIKNNKSILKEGNNVITKTMNGHKATIKAFVKDGKVVSSNVFKGTSARKTTNLIEL